MFDKAYIIGSGGTGGDLIPHLVRTLAFHPKTKNCMITIFDGDTFEEKNQARQLMTPGHVGQNKAEAATQMCNEMGFPNVLAVDEFITLSSFVPYLEESSNPLIIATVDNFASRAAVIRAIETACNDKDFFFITPGNSDGLEEVRGQILWFGRINGQDYGMNPMVYDQDIANPTDTIPRKGSCVLLQESRPQLIAANLKAAADTLMVIQNALDGVLNPTYSQLHFNGTTLKSTIS
jgi:hypothetical protein